MSKAHSQIAGNAIANTLALPCAARKRINITGHQDVLAAIAWSAESGLPLMPLGAGSNVVLPPVLDAAVLNVLDSSTTLLADAQDAVILRVGAGKPWHELVVETVGSGYFGLENLALIPGLVGAAPVQNIGAYGKEFGDFVVAVHGFDLVTGLAQTLSASDCEFAYRDSVFKQKLQDRFLITAVDIELSRKAELNSDYPVLKSRIGSGPVSAQAVLDAVVALRLERLPDPASAPNAGSFFKNPILDAGQLLELQSNEPEVPVYPLPNGLCKVSAAWLIEQAGLRGHSLGRVGVSKQHALVLVTNGSAEQSDVLELARHVHSAVQKRFGVSLEAEPRIYG
ncbi:UDP-N-acetylmuramate dehydrogenase [Congregibacter variabilis]|uniref:UDP-N-acetylenolpyruvoylglucosamine reductase n=1 Tax=Congregibacter variabilis TaxID=3081200 RepID=A0ABZ0I589_9GAMM|nr:UDP-N-acetylmuramate dehydrogenase [Congregibacter sp. IMCC43200]